MGEERKTAFSWAFLAVGRSLDGYAFWIGSASLRVFLGPS